MNFTVKDVVTLFVAGTVCVAFMAVVASPFFNVIIPQTTQTFVMTVFTGLVGGAGSLQLVSIGQKQTLVAQSMSK